MYNLLFNEVSFAHVLTQNTLKQQLAETEKA